MSVVKLSSKGRPTRLRGAKRIKIIDALRDRDGDECHLCGYMMRFVSGNDPEAATVDHMKPRAKGGLDDIKNLKLAHSFCNARRGLGSIGVKGPDLLPGYEKRFAKLFDDKIAKGRDQVRCLGCDDIFWVDHFDEEEHYYTCDNCDDGMGYEEEFGDYSFENGDYPEY